MSSLCFYFTFFGINKHENEREKNKLCHRYNSNIYVVVTCENVLLQLVEKK